MILITMLIFMWLSGAVIIAYAVTARVGSEGSDFSINSWWIFRPVQFGFVIGVLIVTMLSTLTIGFDKADHRKYEKVTEPLYKRVKYNAQNRYQHKIINNARNKKKRILW